MWTVTVFKPKWNNDAGEYENEVLLSETYSGVPQGYIDYDETFVKVSNEDETHVRWIPTSDVHFVELKETA